MSNLENKIIDFDEAKRISLIKEINKQERKGLIDPPQSDYMMQLKANRPDVYKDSFDFIHELPKMIERRQKLAARVGESFPSLEEILDAADDHQTIGSLRNKRGLIMEFNKGESIDNVQKKVSLYDVLDVFNGKKPNYTDKNDQWFVD